MEASPNSVIRKEKAPLQTAPLHEAPSVDRAQDPPGDLQVGVDDHQVPTEEVMHEELDMRHYVIEAPLKQHNTSKTLFSLYVKTEEISQAEQEVQSEDL